MLPPVENVIGSIVKKKNQVIFIEYNIDMEWCICKNFVGLHNGMCRLSFRGYCICRQNDVLYITLNIAELFLLYERKQRDVNTMSNQM